MSNDNFDRQRISAGQPELASIIGAGEPAVIPAMHAEHVLQMTRRIIARKRRRRRWLSATAVAAAYLAGAVTVWMVGANRADATGPQVDVAEAAQITTNQPSGRAIALATADDRKSNRPLRLLEPPVEWVRTPSKSSEPESGSHPSVGNVAEDRNAAPHNATPPETRQMDATQVAWQQISHNPTALRAMASRVPMADRAGLLKRAGDLYLNRTQDVELAVYCYEQVLELETAAGSGEYATGDSWLLAEMRLARGLVRYGD